MLLTRASSNVTGLALFDADGACVYATAGQVSAAPWTVRDCEWFRLATKRSMSVTSFSKPCVQHLFGDQRAYVVSLSRQVEYYSGGGVHTGVLLMDVDYNAFSGLIEDANLGDSGYLYIVDEVGELVAHP